MKYKYDLALSFAGEERNLAAELARRLDASGYSIFYDEFQQAELWGTDLSVALNNVYSNEARYCLVIVSASYVAKPWTNHERQSAISRFIQHRSEYILCLKVDGTDLPGLPSVIGYIDFSKYTEDDVYKLLLRKLGPPDHENQLTQVDSNDRACVQEILEACFRRAIYTRMDSEINLGAMYESIGRALGIVQRVTPRIGNQALQFACGEIIRALDEIERSQVGASETFSVHLSQKLRTEIDNNKQKVVRLLLELRRAADIPMQLPFALTTEHFFRPEDGDRPPENWRF
jgi:TIR domain